MRVFFFIFFIIVSCSKKDVELVNIDNILKQGKKVELFKQNNLSEEKILKIKNINNSFTNIKEWNQNNFNSQNLLPSSRKKIEKKVKSISGNFDQFIATNNSLITIDKKSNIQIYDFDLKKINSKKIYPRKIYKNYNLIFDLIYHKGKIYISDNLGSIFCFDEKNLSQLWAKDLSVPFKSSMKIYKGNIYIINSNSKIFSINSINGKINWSFESSSKIIKDKGSYQLAAYDNKLFFTNDSAEIYCIDLKNNNIKWSLVFRPLDFQKIPLIFRPSPIVLDNKGNLYISSNYGLTYSIDSNLGAIKWSRAISSENIFVVSNNNLFTVTNNRLIILNKLNGQVLYNDKIENKKKGKEVINLEKLFIGGEYIYLFDRFGYMFFVNKNNFNLKNNQKILNDFKNFLIVDDNLFVLNNSSITKF